MKPEAVIFDIGNVLIEWNPERFYDTVMPKPERERMFAAVDLHGMNDAIDRGALFRETIYDWANRNPAWSDKIRLWYDNWIDMASPVISHSVKLQRSLRAKGVPVFALTNFGRYSFEYALSQYDFLAEFDRHYVSGHMEVVKPDPRIYQMVETDCAISPARLLFTDDRAENIAVAAARGWQTHRFDGPQGWADRLVAEGLLTTEEARP